MALRRPCLRYHGMAPMVSHLYELGFLEARAHAQNTCFDAAIRFTRTEGIVPAPESSHAAYLAGGHRPVSLPQD